MPEPGDEGGDCPKCGTSTRMVGYLHVVLGVYCEECELLISLGTPKDVMSYDDLVEEVASS